MSQPSPCPRLVAMYRAMQLRFGYGFASRDANIPRSVKKPKPCATTPICYPTSPVGSQQAVLKVPKRGQFHAGTAIHATPKR